MNRHSPLQTASLYSLVVTWVMLGPLLVFTSQSGFSFELGTSNTAAGFASVALGSAISGAEGDLLRRQEYAVYLICVVLIIPFIRYIAQDLKKNPLIACVLALTWLSALWTVNLKETIEQSLFMTVTLMMAFYLVRRFTPDELFRLLMLVGAVVSLGSVLTIFLLPQYGIQNRAADATSGAWIGIFREKNTCGMELTCLFLPSMFVKLNGMMGKIARIGYMSCILGLLMMSKNLGAWIVCFIAIVLTVLIRMLMRMPASEARAIGFATSGIAIAGLVAVVLDRSAILPLLGKDSALTDRIPIWAAVFVAISKRPLLGYGYSAFWQGLTGESGNTAMLVGWPGLNYSESGLLEVWLGIGIVGVIVVGAIFARAVRDASRCLRSNPSPSAIWSTVMLFVAAATALMEGNPLGAGSLQCLLAFIAYIALRRESQRLELRENVRDEMAAITA
jgi:exopolysaccharide production protein ExoQ